MAAVAGCGLLFSVAPMASAQCVEGVSGTGADEILTVQLNELIPNYWRARKINQFGYSFFDFYIDQRNPSRQRVFIHVHPGSNARPLCANISRRTLHAASATVRNGDVQEAFGILCGVINRRGATASFGLSSASGGDWVLTPGEPACLVIGCDNGQGCFLETTDTTPPVIDPCVDDYTGITFDQIPPFALDLAEFQLQGGDYSDDRDPADQLCVSVDEVRTGRCPIVITRTYTVTDLTGNESAPCVQTISVDNLFAEGGIIWHQPLARKGMSEDTDPSGGGTLKFRFKQGRTIPIQVHAEGCDGADVTANTNVSGTVVVYGDTDADGQIDANELPIDIDFNGVGGAGGSMDKVNGHLKYNLDTSQLPEIPGTKCYLLEVTVEDTTGETYSEIVRLQAK